MSDPCEEGEGAPRWSRSSSEILSQSAAVALSFSVMPVLMIAPPPMVFPSTCTGAAVDQSASAFPVLMFIMMSRSRG